MNEVVGNGTGKAQEEEGEEEKEEEEEEKSEEGNTPAWKDQEWDEAG